MSNFEELLEQMPNKIYPNEYKIITGENGCKRMVLESIPNVYPRSIESRIQIAKNKGCRYVFTIYGFKVYIQGEL